MGAQSNAAPVIIKRKKVTGGEGHHGGAWKVAYADFVTAMMAFFMLMWLLNATTEQQRKGIADYFSPDDPGEPGVGRGARAASGGESIFSEQTMARVGTGATALRPLEGSGARGMLGGEAEARAEEEALRALEEMLLGRGGESALRENELRHIVTRITDEGLVIELFALEGLPLFLRGTEAPTQLLEDLLAVVAQAARTVTNPVALAAHVSADPVVLAESPAWPLSAARADRVRRALGAKGLARERVRRVTGHADRSPVLRDPMAPRNNRVEIILLREVPRR